MYVVHGGYVRRQNETQCMIATLRHRPYTQGVCSGFLELLDQLLREEGVESMGDVIAALLSAQSHLQKNLAVFVHQAQQFDHVLC